MKSLSRENVNFELCSANGGAWYFSQLFKIQAFYQFFTNLLIFLLNVKKAHRGLIKIMLKLQTNFQSITQHFTPGNFKFYTLRNLKEKLFEKIEKPALKYYFDSV
jgi:hypothetical protein